MLIKYGIISYKEKWICIMFLLLVVSRLIVERYLECRSEPLVFILITLTTCQYCILCSLVTLWWVEPNSETLVVFGQTCVTTRWWRGSSVRFYLEKRELCKRLVKDWSRPPLYHSHLLMQSYCSLFHEATTVQRNSSCNGTVILYENNKFIWMLV